MYTIPISRYKICTPPWGYRTSLAHLFLHSKNFITFPLADKFNQWKCLAILHRVNGRVYLRRPNSHLHYFAFNVLLFQSWPWDCFYNLHNLLYEQSVIFFLEKCVCVCIATAHFGSFLPKINGKSLNLAVWAGSLIFLFDFTLFVMGSLSQNRLFSKTRLSLLTWHVLW